ncbi:MAG: ABC transporter substrate-binding protein, partial [Proteobacteria bacterium]|nr:ABC transporter substrate-binding protein [Pseudomonadota bacterium]
MLVSLALGPTGSRAANWTDALGRSVVVADVPRRIVSLVPSVTEMLFALGAGDRIVGVTEFSDFPEETRALPKVGSYAEPSLEAVVALEPDLVIAAADMTRPTTVSRLEAVAVPVYVVYPRNLAGTAQAL